MFLKKYLCVTISLLLSFQTFCTSNIQLNQEKPIEKKFYQKKKVIIPILGLSTFALLCWLMHSRFSKSKTNNSETNKQQNKIQHNDDYLEKEKDLFAKKKAQYNAERKEVINEYLTYNKKYIAYNNENKISLERYLGCDNLMKKNIFNKICDAIINSEIYFKNKLIDDLSEIEKIKLYCFFHFFSEKSNEYCEQIWLKTSNDSNDNNKISDDFDFYDNQSKWLIVPTYDEIFSSIADYIFVNNENNICFGTKESYIPIKNIKSVSDFFVDLASINSYMTAIYLALMEKNLDFVIDTLVPRLQTLLDKGEDLRDNQKIEWFLRFIFETGD